MSTTCSRELSITIGAGIPEPFSYYKLDSFDGTNIVDSVSARDLTGATTSGQPTLVAGKIGNALQYDASATPSATVYQRVNSDMDIGGLDATIRYWIFYTSGTFAMNVDDFDVFNGLLVRCGASGSDMVARTSDGTNSVVSMLVPGQWNHIIGWRKGDGSEIGIRVNNGTPVTAASFAIASTGTMRIRFETFPNGLWIVDEVALWKGQVLTTAQQDADWNDGDGVTYPF